MTILVTGSSGYIGSCLVYGFADNNIDVVTLDNRFLNNNFEPINKPENHIIENYILDISILDEIDVIIKKHNIKTIFHLAALVSVEESQSNPNAYFENNYDYTKRLAQVSANNGVENFIFSSTASVYGTPKIDLVNEDYPLGPESIYGHSKMLAEQSIQEICKQSGMKYAILRYFNVSGADRLLRAGQTSPNSKHLINMVSHALVGNIEKINIFGNDYDTPDGTCIRDYIHISDLVDIHIKVLDYLKENNSIIMNCGYGKGYSVLEIINAANKLYQLNSAIPPIKYDIMPRRDGDVAKIVADNSLLVKELNWKPKYDNIQGIISSARDWQQRLSGW